MLRLRLLILLLGLSITALAQRSKFFRKDYKYISEYDSFYKFYKKSDGNWLFAFQTCMEDGAQIFYPKTQDEIKAVREILTSDGEILVGIRDNFGTGEFATVDGSVTPMSLFESEPPPLPSVQCLVLNMKNGTYKDYPCEIAENNSDEDSDEVNKMPFICKKTVESELCPTVDKAYVYQKNVNKCFKVNIIPKTWREAYITCNMEGANLVVFKSDLELSKIEEIIHGIKDFPPNYFIGFRKQNHTGDFYTARGIRMDDEVFQKWEDKEKESSQECGALTYHRKIEIDFYDEVINIPPTNYDRVIYSTKPCDNRLPFICQMNVVL